jgi:ABC-2 type transport system ATP-binding protein
MGHVMNGERAVGASAGRTHDGIRLVGLSRTYRPRGGRAVQALEGVSFEVRPGEIVGLLGANGAGKTTTVRILATLLLPTGGEATVAGADVVREPRRVRSLCGVSFGGDLGLYGRLSARDNLRYFATMYRLDPRRARDRVELLLRQVGLADRAADRVENFSRGMRQRLHLARAVLHDPAVLLLDEPSAGLDPHAARDVRALVSGLAEQGRAILLTTHDLWEAEALCSRIVVLDHGRILRHATPRELRDEATARLGTCLEFVVAADFQERMLERVPGLVTWGRQDGVVRVYSRDPSSASNYLLHHVTPDSLQISKPSLEEAYLHLVERDE